MGAVILMSDKANMFISKTHKDQGKTILAICDNGLLGKTLRFGEVDFDVSESFYGGEESDGDEILEKIGKADMVNVVGKEIVDLLIREGMVDEKCVLWMGDVPHVQIIRI